jgi:cytochrome b561
MAQVPSRYSHLLIALHWILAILLIVALVMGSQVLEKIPNTDPEKINALRGHMIAGGLILILTLIRIVVRFTTPQPAPIVTSNAFLDKVAHIVHALLNLLVLVMAGSGIAMAIAAGLPEIVFGGGASPLPESFREFPARAVHGIAAKLLMAAIALHIVGALYHQFILKDNLMAWMRFGKK